MAAINPLARELVLKIVFYGPGLGGKTTTLQHVHDMAKPEQRGKMVSLATAVDRTLYFDFLPLRLPKTRGMNVRLQLFTVPGQVYYNSTRKLVLTGADGIVFVADSQVARADANLESLENLQENLRDQKREQSAPLVIQYNKRDLPDVVPVAELERTLNPHGVPSVETIATKGVGVFESLSLITKAALAAINDTLPAPGGSAEYRLANAEGGLSEALRGADSSRGSEHRQTRKVSIVTENLIDSATPGSLSGFGEGDSDLFQLGQLIQPSPVPSIVAEAAKLVAPEQDAIPPATSTLPAASVATVTPPSTRIAAPPSPAPSHATEKPVGWGTPLIRPESHGFSFAGLWGDAERELVRELESSIGSRSLGRAVDLLDAIATRVLASAGVLLGSTEAPRDAALVPTLLGISGPRYVWFRALVRDVRGGTEPDERSVLAAYAFVIELRLARGRVGP